MRLIINRWLRRAHIAFKRRIFSPEVGGSMDGFDGCCCIGFFCEKKLFRSFLPRPSRTSSDESVTTSSDTHSPLLFIYFISIYPIIADNGSMMAYTSSWGEANPNGSKDQIDEYLERTRDEVKGTEQLLKQICSYLDLKELPPIKGPM